jgi:hypothetical protein
MKRLALFCVLNGLIAILAGGSAAAPTDPPGPAAARSGGSTGDTVLTKARLMSAALAGGEYILRMQRADGSFVYYYDPDRDAEIKSQYNIIRHAGAIYALYQLYEATRDPRYLAATRKAVAFLRTRFRPLPAEKAIYVLDFNNKAKLGANGLALIALVEQLKLDPGAASLDEARGLGRMILAMQGKNGSFRSYYVAAVSDMANDSLYYPGEAILGLVDLYGVTKDERLLESARAAADYLVASQDKLKELPPDAWLMQALELLNGIAPNPRYVDHAIAIGESMIAYQYTEMDPPGYAGGVRPGVPRSTPASSRAEGLLAAYRLARASGDPRAEDLGMALKASARFQLQQEFPLSGRDGLPNPARAAGGSRESLDDNRIRIDFVQHNVSSLLGMARTLF